MARHDPLNPGVGRAVPTPPAIRRDEDVGALIDDFTPVRPLPDVPIFSRQDPEPEFGLDPGHGIEGPTTSFRTDGGTITTFPPQGPPGNVYGPPGLPIDEIDGLDGNRPQLEPDRSTEVGPWEPSAESFNAVTPELLSEPDGVRLPPPGPVTGLPFRAPLSDEPDGPSTGPFRPPTGPDQSLVEWATPDATAPSSDRRLTVDEALSGLDHPVETERDDHVPQWPVHNSGPVSDRAPIGRPSEGDSSAGHPVRGRTGPGDDLDRLLADLSAVADHPEVASEPPRSSKNVGFDPAPRPAGLSVPGRDRPTPHFVGRSFLPAEDEQDEEWFDGRSPSMLLPGLLLLAVAVGTLALVLLTLG